MTHNYLLRWLKIIHSWGSAVAVKGVYSFDSELKEKLNKIFSNKYE